MSLRRQLVPTDKVHLRIALLLAKVPQEHVETMFRPQFWCPVEIYERGGRYDVVFCFNLTPEIRFIRQHTDTKLFAIAPEPPRFCPHNYDSSLVDLCDYYAGYGPFYGPSFKGIYRHWTYPAVTRADLERSFDRNILSAAGWEGAIFAGSGGHLPET